MISRFKGNIDFQVIQLLLWAFSSENSNALRDWDWLEKKTLVGGCRVNPIFQIKIRGSCVLLTGIDVHTDF